VMDLAAAEIIRDVAVLPTMYALMSLNEYMTHRYFQHMEFNRPGTLLWLKAIIAKATGDPIAPKVPGDGHVEHHAETYDDMSLKNDERWRSNSVAKALDADEFRGTAFHWSATGIIHTDAALGTADLCTHGLVGAGDVGILDAIVALARPVVECDPPAYARPAARAAYHRSRYGHTWWQSLL